MRVMRKMRKAILILSVMLCLYANLIIVEAMLCGTLPPHHLAAMVVVFVWLSLMYYANFIYVKER